MLAPGNDHMMFEYLIRVEGYVQGVGYRVFAQREARQLGLVGFAANQPDGCVEIIAQGLKSDLDNFVASLRHGPSMAQVNDVNVVERDPSRISKTFEIR